MIGEIVSILTDRERHSREYRSTNIPSNIACRDVWRGAFEIARGLGFSVEMDGDHITLRKGRSYGTFQYNEGGAGLAREFLRGVG